MQNPFPYADDNKRYHTLAYANRQKFGRRIGKAVIDAGFTCPNLDGTCGTGGCIFCDGGSGYFTQQAVMPIPEQIAAELQRLRQKEPQAEAIAYFQAHTNTYAPLDRLQDAYETALAQPGIVGLAIGTRPDCLPTPVLDYLTTLSKRTALTVELGLQTIHDKTAAQINRGYPYAVFLEAFRQLRARGIRICVHLINGLPGETPADMLASAQAVGQLRPDGIKLQLLHVIRGTVLADWYATGRVTPMTQADYVNCIVSQLALLPPETVIERITGDGDRRTLLAPDWSMQKRRVLAAIDKAQVQQDSWQGKAFPHAPGST